MCEMTMRGALGYALMLLLLCYEVLCCVKNQATGNLLFGMLFISSLLITAGILTVGSSKVTEHDLSNEDGGSNDL